MVGSNKRKIDSGRQVLVPIGVFVTASCDSAKPHNIFCNDMANSV